MLRGSNMDFNQAFKKKYKKQKKKKSQLPFRLNILFIAVFLIFSLLIVQLGVVQILNGEEAQRQIDQTENTPTEKSVPRGKFYDSNYDLVVDNKAVKSITYTPPKNGDTADDKLKLAEDLASYITIYKEEEELEDAVTDRDKREYYYLENTEDIQDRLTEEELDLDPSERYQKELDAITEEEIENFDWNHDLLNVIAIRKELDEAQELSSHVVVNEGLTDEEYALVSEHLPQLNGIDAVIDWDREPAFGETFNSFLGGITSSDEGIPQDRSQFYLANGYKRNDRVGTSGLEEQYENVLRGRKEKVQYTTSTRGEVLSSDVVVEGQRGKDLTLTVDMEFQQAVDEIVQEELETAINNPANNNGYLEDALAVVMNPQTGDILAMSGSHYNREDKEYENQAYRTIYDAHEVGSSIKGATLLAGYQEGIVDIGSVLVDESLYIQSTPTFSSIGAAMGPIDDLTALEKSSNVYMGKIAIQMAGATYQRNEILHNFDYAAFDKLRSYYSQFGLGSSTGIDLPYEATGLAGSDVDQGNLLYMAIGQYDTYTTLQLAQYVSTIANDGYRMKPRLVNEIREPSGEEGVPGKVIESFEPEVMNKIDMDQKYIDRVQEGFRRVYTSGTARSYWSGIPYEVAGKTGTAERPQYNEDGDKIADTDNLTLVGYTPLEEPELAFAVIVPENGTEGETHKAHHEIGKRIVETYYDMQEEQSEEDEE